MPRTRAAHRNAGRRPRGQVCLENGCGRKATRKRVYLSDSDNNSLETGERRKGRAGSSRKVLRKCAAAAANKIKLMSDVEENSSSESPCSGRRVPHRNASAVARKKLLHNSEDDQSLKSEAEEEKEKPASPGSPPQAAPHTANGLGSGDSESDCDLQAARKNWHANGYRPHPPAAAKTKFLKIESSEEDEKSHDSDRGRDRTAGPSTSGQKPEPEGVSEEEGAPHSEPGRSRKNVAFLKKAKIFSDSEDSESGKQDPGDDGQHDQAQSPAPGTLGSEPVAGAQQVSEAESESDGSKARGKVNSFTEDSLQHFGQRRKVSRKRVCSSDSDSNSKEVKRSSRARGGLLRVPRRCAVNAASQLRLRSDAVRRSAESVCTRSKNGRQRPLQLASAVAKKGASGSGGAVSCEAGQGALPSADGAASTQSAPLPVTADSGSEGMCGPQPKDRHASGHEAQAAPKTKTSVIGSSEEESNSHVPAGETSRPSEAASARKALTENSFEAELNYGLRRWNGRRLRTYGKAPSGKAAVAQGSAELRRGRSLPEPAHARPSEATESSPCGPEPPPPSESEPASGTDSDADCTVGTNAKKRKMKGKAKAVRKGKMPAASVCGSGRPQRQSKRPRLAVDDDWEELDSRVLRRSKIKTRNQGRRTVRYHDGDDERSLENVAESDDGTL